MLVTGLIKFYITDEITEQELEAIMKYMAIATSQVEVH